jgi:hypothetical protein
MLHSSGVVASLTQQGIEREHHPIAQHGIRRNISLAQHGVRHGRILTQYKFGCEHILTYCWVGGNTSRSHLELCAIIPWLNMKFNQKKKHNLILSWHFRTTQASLGWSKRNSQRRCCVTRGFVGKPLINQEWRF